MSDRTLAGDIPLHVTSIYGHDTRQPWVQISLGGVESLMPPWQAQMVAAWLNEAAEAALQDAFLVEWMSETFEMELPEAAMILREYRAWRKQRFDERDGDAGE